MTDSTPLHIVTGKGGTGKTTVAAALAMALARSGKHVLLCEVESRQGISRLFDVPPLPFEERRIAVGLGGQVSALALEPEAALLEYLEIFYKLGRAGRALDRFGVIDFATTIAPGVRDVLLTGKIYEIASWRRRTDKNGGRRPGQVYDAIVLDAPPTGRVTRFLNVGGEVAGLAKVGPIRRQADSVMELMHDRRTVVHFVTILEEMPVQETLDGIAELRGSGLNIGSIIVNQVQPEALSADTAAALDGGTLTPTDVERALKATGLSPAAAPLLLRQGRDNLVHAAQERAQYALLGQAEAPIVELPRLPEIDIGALLDVAERLTDV